MLEESLALRRKLLGARHKDVAVTLSELGRSYGALGQADRAESLAREALELRRSVLGEVHRETATSMGDLGLMLWQRGDLAGAEPLLRRSLEISRQVLGEYHANVGSALSNLALVVADRGNYAAAEPLFRQAVEVRRRALGAHHPGLAVTLNNLAYALRELRKYDEAVAAMNEALSLSLPAGEESPAVANYRANLARVYIASSRPEAAEPLLRRSLDVRLRVYGANDWRVAMTKSLLGEALTGLGRYAEAEPLLLDARRLLKEVPGPQGREARATATRLRTLYESRDRAAASALQSRVAVARTR
jgi:tetratricopeptide (TPR) repeat protein